MLMGYRRSDGRVGIRNHVLVVYTVRCSEHVARKICQEVPGTQLLGYDSCFADPYGYRIVAQMAGHPNVAGVLFVSHGCESSPIQAWMEEARQAGKEAALVTVQRDGGTLPSIEKGAALARGMVERAKQIPAVPIRLEELTIGVECGGSDASSGLAANPATGRAMDRFVDLGGRCIFSELAELLGTDRYILARAENDQIREQIADGLRRAKLLGQRMESFSISTGNEDSGLTTIEEKSLGAFCKAGARPIHGVLKSAQVPWEAGLYLLDKVGEVDSWQLTAYEETDHEGFLAHAACGAQLVIFTTGCGSVAGSAVVPVLKVCGNPETVARMPGDFDVDAGTIIQGTEDLDQVAEKILAAVERTCSGQPTRAEALGHEEFLITRKPTRACEVRYC